MCMCGKESSSRERPRNPGVHKGQGWGEDLGWRKLARTPPPTPALEYLSTYLLSGPFPSPVSQAKTTPPSTRLRNGSHSQTTTTPKTPLLNHVDSLLMYGPVPRRERSVAKRSRSGREDSCSLGYLYECIPILHVTVHLVINYLPTNFTSFANYSNHHNHHNHPSKLLSI